MTAAATEALSAAIRAIAYRRVSKGEQAAAWKTSLATQAAAVQELAGKLGVELLEDMIFEDTASAARTWMAGRGSARWSSTA